jgi:hypothetical protein
MKHLAKISAIVAIAFGLLIILMLIAQPASTQDLLPRTVPLNDRNGVLVGTGTIHNGRMYLRDLKGVHFATIVVEQDGTQTLYDPSGNFIEKRERQEVK